MSIHIGDLTSMINWWTLPAAIPYVIEGWSSPFAQYCKEWLSAKKPRTPGHWGVPVMVAILIAALVFPLAAATSVALRPLAQFSSTVKEAGLKPTGHVVQRDSEGSGIILYEVNGKSMTTVNQLVAFELQ